MILVTLLLLSSQLLEQVHGETREYVASGRVLADLTVNDTDGKLAFCNLSIVKEEDRASFLSSLPAKPLRVVGFHEMLSLVDECDLWTKEGDLQEDEEEEFSYWSLISGIFPGTLWCGFNDIAPQYSSLGRSRALDRCCRTHDFCPEKIKSFSIKETLINPSPYTKSHCECEQRFYNCLKTSNSSLGHSLGKFYFNSLNLECIDYVQPVKCVQHTNFTQYSQDLLAPEELQMLYSVHINGSVYDEDPNKDYRDYRDYPDTECEDWVPDFAKLRELSFVSNNRTF